MPAAFNSSIYVFIHYFFLGGGGGRGGDKRGFPTGSNLYSLNSVFESTELGISILTRVTEL